MKEEYTPKYRRWYDKDPVLSSAMKTLEHSDDKTQIKIALNLIKIIIEHNIESSEYSSVEDVLAQVDLSVNENSQYNRWYDIDSTLRTAIKMLQGCPEDTQHTIAKEMAKLVVEKIKEEDVTE
ncbi:hypothetical protein IJV79_00395 [bacterium]|nr:hypothetical protein [bacterium]